MSITSFINRISAQTAVRWGTPVPDGMGGYTYADPVEFNCRWEEVTKLIVNRNRDAEEEISTAQIITNTVLVEGDMVFLGSLDDLDDLELDIDSGYYHPQPIIVEDAYKVLAKDKIPWIKSDSIFVRMYYLKPNWEQKL